MSLTNVDESLLVAAYFRGGTEDTGWTSNSDQIVALSLFYTGDITFEDCQNRFSMGCIKNYDKLTNLWPEVRERYRSLLDLASRHPDLIEAAGDLVTPADPTYTSCRLTAEGLKVAVQFVDLFPPKPDFPHWPDNRARPFGS